MNSNKDFINIDELFQQLRESDSKPFGTDAAWNKFRDQLDAELPLPNPKKGIGRRRYFYPLLALLLTVGTATTAYYVHNTESNAGNMDASAVANTSTNTINSATSVASNTFANSSNDNNNAPDNDNYQEALASVNTSATDTKHHKKSNKQAATRNTAAQQVNSTNTVLASTNNTANTPLRAHAVQEIIDQQQVKIENKTSKSNNNQIATPNIVASNNNTNPQQGLMVDNDKSNKPLALKPTIQAPKQQQIEKVATLSNPIKPGLALENNDITPAPTNNIAQQNEQTLDNNTQTVQKQFEEKIVKENTTYVKNHEGNWFEEKNIPTTIIKTARIKDAETNTFSIDTLSVEETIVAKYFPVATEAVETPTNELSRAVNANINLKKIQFTDLKSLEEDKVETIGEENKNRFFKQYIQRDDLLNFFNRNDKFEAMITFGGIYSPAATGAYGFSFGLGGLYNISERLSVVLEAKYVHKIFTNFYQNDVSKQYNVQQNGSLFNGQETTVNTEYTIRNYNSFELPLYLNYKIGDRLSMFGGLQFVYAAPIKWDVNKETIIKDYTSLIAPKSQENIINQQVDFASRSGFGFLAGIGFDASKRIGLDFRVSQNFYNKNYSNNNVINGIYNSPVFSITLGYYFGKKDKIYYLMKNK